MPLGDDSGVPKIQANAPSRAAASAAELTARYARTKRRKQILLIVAAVLAVFFYFFLKYFVPEYIRQRSGIPSE